MKKDAGLSQDGMTAKATEKYPLTERVSMFIELCSNGSIDVRSENYTLTTFVANAGAAIPCIFKP